MAKWFRVPGTRKEDLNQGYLALDALRKTGLYQEVRIRVRREMSGPPGDRQLEFDHCFLEAKRKPDVEKLVEELKKNAK